MVLTQKLSYMDVIRDVIQNSALGPFSNWTKGIVLSIFSSIVCALAIMLVVLLKYGPEMSIRFGY